MDEDEAVSMSHESPRARKHGRDSTTNGFTIEDASSRQAPPAKRIRRINGTAVTTNGNGTGNENFAKSGDGMETDQHSASHADSMSKRDLATAAAAVVPSQSGNVATTANGTETMESTTGEVVDVDADADADDDALQTQAQAQAPNNDNHNNATLVSLMPPVPTLTNGRSVGVQSDKVAELGPETAVLSVPDRNVTHAAWNPQDAAILATGGDALARIWTIPSHTRSSSSSASSDHQNDPNRQFVDLLEPSDTATVTSMVWSPDGENLAVATHGMHRNSKGSVTIRTKTGAFQDELPGGQDWVLNLSWNPSGSLLLGITHFDESDSTLVVWDVKTGQPMQPLELDKAVMDATWIDDRRFIVCGTDLIAETVIDSQDMELLQNRTGAGVNQEWTKIRYDPLTRTTAMVAEESGTLAVISASNQFYSARVHDAEISALAYQPLSNPSAHSESSPRLFATSSSDGTIKVWNAKSPLNNLHTLSLGRTASALAMSFTPDGYLVAAASWNKVLIWSAETGGVPKASWKGIDGQWQPEKGEQQEGGSGNGVEMKEQMPIPSLSWDMDGGKLAYGLRSQVGRKIDEERRKTFRGRN